MYLCPMQGIYIHVPFCKQACHYCDFHFSTSLKYKDEMLQALQKEIQLRAEYLPHKTINSIYFGGGTPSLLNESELNALLNCIRDKFEVAENAEITLEANPDDITTQKVKDWKKVGINRLSIGIQSFFEEDLLWMNRAHNKQQAEACIEIAVQSGIKNITADLIYGYPLLTNKKWESNIEMMLNSYINHLSAYSLTVEPKTALAHQIKKGNSPAPMPEQAAQHFEMLMDAIAEKGWTHYEISNYCKTDNYAVHNTNYWRSYPYLGVGPSAHSFDGISRQWNIANNAKYMKALQDDTLAAETEPLTPADKFNEYVMTGLRTMWGIDFERIEQQWGNTFAEHLRQEVQPFIADGAVTQQKNLFTLTRKGKLLADYIASELFWVE